MKNMNKRKHLLAGALLASLGLTSGASATDYTFTLDNLDLFDNGTLVDPGTYGTFGGTNYTASFDISVTASAFTDGHTGFGGAKFDVALNGLTGSSWAAGSDITWFANFDGGSNTADFLDMGATVGGGEAPLTTLIGTVTLDIADPSATDTMVGLANVVAGGVNGSDIVTNAVAVDASGVSLQIVFPGSVVVEGDFDSDSDVDGADFLIWQAGFGTIGGATLATGDATGDGNVDGADFLVWQANFGTGTAAVIAVPEPASVALLIGAGISLAARRRK